MTLLSRFAGLVCLSLLLVGVSINAGCETPAVSQQDPPSEEQKSVQDKESEAEASKAEEESSKSAAEDAKQQVAQVDEKEAAVGENELEDENPFTRRIRVPDFPKDMQWLNTSGPLRQRDLKGKFVVLDFWTYCCINCIHILPELKKLEKAYPNELVVIGVHSAKFETEQDSKNISEAILRYEIEHPVVNDADHKIWNMFGVRSWPTVLMIDPEGHAVWGTGGEVQFETLDAILKKGIPYYKKKGTLDESPIHFNLLAHSQKKTPLRFPGKVLADEPGNRLFIADSNHNRIVIASLDGKLIDTIGTGAIGRKDGGFDAATFDHPQGMVLLDQILYIADTENHLIRKIDLTGKQVKTIAGLGIQGRNPWPGLDRDGPLDALPERFVGKPLETGLNSPWALWIHKDDMYIAMAGPHQIWKMPLDESEIGPYAGNGREDIVDGPLLPKQPYEKGFSSFAQPSGLASDGKWLFVADSEGSSIRAVPFDPKLEVRTVVGSSKLPFARLFTFGDRDGTGLLEVETNEAGQPKFGEGNDILTKGPLLQHALGVVYRDGTIYVADTYNNKIKTVNAETGETKSLAGTGEPGSDDAAGTFDEPAGITLAKGTLYVADTNNHAIRTVNLKTGKVGTFVIDGLTSPKPTKKRKPTFPSASQVNVDLARVKPVNGKITLKVELKLAEGWKINDLAPMRYLLEAEGDAGSVDRTKLSEELVRVEKPAKQFDISIPVAKDGKDTIKVSMNYYYCQEGGGGLCKVGSVVWTVPLDVTGSATAGSSTLRHSIQ